MSLFAYANLPSLFCEQHLILAGLREQQNGWSIITDPPGSCLSTLIPIPSEIPNCDCLWGLLLLVPLENQGCWPVNLKNASLWTNRKLKQRCLFCS